MVAGLQLRLSRIPVSAVLVCAGLAVLFEFPPARYPIYPQCPFFAVTHLLCPGCGGTRAIYELLHLNVAGALHYNALVTVLAPPAMIWLIRSWYRVWRYHESFPAVPWPRGTALILGSVAVLFAIVRDAGIAFVM